MPAADQEKFEFEAAVSLKHLPREKWEALLYEATRRVYSQLCEAEKIYKGFGSYTGRDNLVSILAVYDRLSELMPRPFPDISPAEEEDEERPEGEPGAPRSSGGLPPHVDRTGG